MRKIFTFLFLYVTITINSQDISGIVKYSADLNIKQIPENKLEEISKENVQQLKFVLENSKPVDFQLKFNNNESIYEKLEQLDIVSERNVENITNIITGKGKYYTNKLTDEILNQKNSFGQLFIVSMDKKKWVLINETKKIKNYLCYKAKTLKKIENSQGLTEFDVIAWYTTKLPFSYGPKEFNGLPGLILELTDGNITIKVTEIDLNPDGDFKIKKPIKGKKITLTKFNIIAKNMFENRGSFK